MKANSIPFYRRENEKQNKKNNAIFASCGQRYSHQHMYDVRSSRSSLGNRMNSSDDILIMRSDSNNNFINEFTMQTEFFLNISRSSSREQRQNVANVIPFPPLRCIDDVCLYYFKREKKSGDGTHVCAVRYPRTRILF